MHKMFLYFLGFYQLFVHYILCPAFPLCHPSSVAVKLEDLCLFEIGGNISKSCCMFEKTTSRPNVQDLQESLGMKPNI